MRGFTFKAWKPVALPLGRVVVSKTTHLGDLVISLPMATALKQRDPSCTVIFLTNSKTLEVARCCPDIDEVYAAPESQQEAAALLTSLKIDIFIQVNNSRVLGAAARQAKIPVRVGSLYRLYNLPQFTHLVATSRAFRGLNKRQLDLEYLLPLGVTAGSLQAIGGMYRLVAPPPPLMPQQFADGRRAIVLSPGMITARAHQWPLESWSTLIEQFDPQRYHWFICGLDAERAQLAPLLDRHAHASNVTDLVGTLPLKAFVGFLAACDGMIAGSTGPLHLAAALGIHTLGLFQSRRGDVKRWYPVGQSASAIHSDVACRGERRGSAGGQVLACPCIAAIDVETVANCVRAWFEQHD